MPISATMIRTLLGLGTHMYSNALHKLPYMRHSISYSPLFTLNFQIPIPLYPWEHALGMGLGVVFVNQLVKWDAQLQEDLDKMLEKAKAANERRYFEQEDKFATLKYFTMVSDWIYKNENQDIYMLLY
ncbi:hypothetical protein UlMin_043004 [Ulmus minor]